jgi:NAD(P)-dependent dehydrogenase (short-subunit alcohol dehydrogenase family)
VANPKNVEALVKAVAERYGRLDCAFNNAGIEGSSRARPNFRSRNGIA